MIVKVQVKVRSTYVAPANTYAHDLWQDVWGLEGRESCTLGEVPQGLNFLGKGMKMMPFSHLLKLKQKDLNFSWCICYIFICYEVLELMHYNINKNILEYALLYYFQTKNRYHIFIVIAETFFRNNRTVPILKFKIQ